MVKFYLLSLPYIVQSCVWWHEVFHQYTFFILILQSLSFIKHYTFHKFQHVPFVSSHNNSLRFLKWLFDDLPLIFPFTFCLYKHLSKFTNSAFIVHLLLRLYLTTCYSGVLSPNFAFPTRICGNAELFLSSSWRNIGQLKCSSVHS